MTVYISESKIVSLNKINQDLKDFFTEKKIKLSTNKIEGDVQVQHFFKKRNMWSKFKKNILIQPLDGTIIKERYVRMMNEWDIIITPSNIGKQIMIDNGISTKIEVVPNYWENEILIDNSFFSNKFNEKKWTFYTESSGWERKNIKNLLKYFIEEFRNDESVRLVIKLSEKKRKDIIIPDDIKCEVVIIDEHISKKNIFSLMINCDCYICLSYMEGFCIPLLNAAVLKKDIICLDSKISGYKDFLNKENSIMINCKEIPIFNTKESISIYELNSIWEESDYNQYKDALRKSYERKYKFVKNDDFSEFHKEKVMNRYLKIIE